MAVGASGGPEWDRRSQAACRTKARQTHQASRGKCRLAPPCLHRHPSTFGLPPHPGTNVLGHQTIWETNVKLFKYIKLVLEPQRKLTL